MKKNTPIRRLTETALLLAIGYLLSMLKIKLPMSSITLVSMLPLVMLGYKYGPAWGALSGFVHGLLQMFEGGIYTPPSKTVLAYIGTLVLDYLLAWLMVGLLAGWCGKLPLSLSAVLPIGAFVGIAGRYLCSFTSGILIWRAYAPDGKSLVLYSLIQNGITMLPEMLLTAIVAFLITKVTPVQRFLTEIRTEQK